MKTKFFTKEELDKDREYKFSEEDIQFPRKLNKKLCKEEQRFLALHDELKPQLTALCSHQAIDDFNYHMKPAIFINNRKRNALHDVFNGDPIWEDKTWSLFTDKAHRGILEDNWNETQDKTHPLADISFCYTMHCVVFHSALLWEDILCIDTIRLELKIDYQFLYNDKEKRRFHKLNKQRIAAGNLI
ncbi:MAG TPA: hypothetical protein VFL76_03900 [Edaphocola sp.]|nr:hypothetical protein [Edaphocola sp.]